MSVLTWNDFWLRGNFKSWVFVQISANNQILTMELSLSQNRFLLFFFFLVSIVFWMSKRHSVNLFELKFLTSYSSSEFWGLPCPCRSCISRSWSVCFIWPIHRSSLSAELKKDVSFWFFLPLYVSRSLGNICQEDMTAVICEQISAESWFLSI